MSFTFGTFDTDQAGLIATLRRLPSLGGLQLETLEAPGADGLILGGTTLTSAQFVFDVVIASKTLDGAHEARDLAVLALDPRRGEQDLTFDAAPGWRWRSITSSAIEWERVTWFPGSYTLRADVTFNALEGYGRLVTDEAWEYTTPGNRKITREKGNAHSFPEVEIRGTLTSAQTVTVTIGDVAVTVGGPLAAGQVLRLDWDTFEFARWSGLTKIASVVRSMSTLDRPELWPNTLTDFNVATTGTVTQVRLRANSRRQ